jgi:YD repeat-containing protein
MRISYDSEIDALSIIFRDMTVTTQELAEGIAAEYDAQGRLVGIEILDAVKQLGEPSVLQQVIFERPSPADREASDDIW